jgi:ArsR family transcriptional regulator, virulence genes transcriptional regulator
MDAIDPSGMPHLAIRAAEAARLLGALANENRLLILCHLTARQEMTVGALADAVGLSQSALSQHLARLRAEGLVVFRRNAQTLHYRVGDPKAGQVLALLKDIYCPLISAE